ncbi:hypothetical protein QE152_g37587 [Popillia japonica]|uniref:Uncharacterized protein n=1 Tax=Popillia japonica TaxID=7064 RepID=A0AAW1IA45_POPJA
MKGDDMKMEMKPQEKVEADVKEEKDKDTTIKDGEEEASADNGDDIEEEALDAKKMICSVQKIKTAEDMKQVTEDRKPPSVKDIEITLEAKELEKTRIEDEKLQKLKDEEVKDIETEVAEKPDETKYVKEKVIRKTLDVQSENAKDSDLAVAAKVEQLNVCTMEKDTVDIKPEAEEVKHEKPVQDGKITREEIVENTEPEREAVENKEIKIIDTKDNQKETVKDIKIDSQKEVETVEVTEITKTMEEDEVPDSIKPIPKEKVESMEEHDTMKIQSEKVSCQEPVEAEKMKEFEITEPTKAKKENDLEPTKPTVEEKTEGMDDTEKEHDATKVESEIIEQEKVEPQEKFETLQAEKAEVKVTGTVKANEEKDQKSTKSVPGEKVEAMGDIDKKEDTLKLEKQLEKEKVTSQEKPETIQPKKIEEIEVCETTKAKEEKDLEPMKPVLAGKEEGAESIEKVQDTIKVEPKIIEEEKVTSQEKLETIQPKKIKDIQLSEATKITERKDSESTKPVLEKEVESIKDDKKEVEVGLTKTIDDTKDIDQEKMAMDTKITKDKIEESELISASKVDDPQIAEIEKIKEAAEEEKDVADALSREKLENVTVLQPDKIQEEKEKPVPITEEQKIDEVKLITEEKLDKIENEAVKKGEIVMPEGDTIDKTKINDTDEENAALKKQTEEAQIDQIKKVESVVQEKEKSSEVSPLEVEEPKSIQIEKAQETKSLSIQKDVDKKKEEVIDEAGLESSTVIPGDTTQIENKSEHVGREKMTEKDTTEETVVDKINETMEKTHVPVKEELTQVQNATASRTDTRQEFSKSDKADVKELENELETDQKDITGISEQKIEEKIEAQEKEIMSMEQSKITSEMSTNDVKETEGIIETSEGVSKVLIQAQLEQSKQTTKTDLEKTSQGDKCIKVDATEDKKHEKLTPEVKEILAAKEKEEPAELKILSEISAQKELPISETVKESNDLANVSQDKQLGLEEEQVSEQVPTGKDLKQELEECILDNEAKLSQIEQIKQIDFDDTSEERDVTFYIGDQKLEKTKADQKDEKPESKEQEKSRLDEKDTDDKQKQTDEFETDMPRKGEDIPGEKKADELHESAEVHSEPKLISSISEKKSETKEVEEVIEVKKEANADQVDKSHVVLHKDTEVEKAEIMIPGTSVEAMYDSNKYANGVQDRIETIQKPIVTEKNVVEDEKGTKEIAEQKVNKEEVNDQTLKEDTEMTNGESTKDIENDKIDDKIISVAKEAKESRQSDSKDIRIDQEQQILESKPSIPAIDATATVSDIDTNKELSTGKVVDKDGAFLRETQIDETKSGSQTESPETSSEQALQTFKENEILDKVELGRKSPKEREQDVAKIVASVAEVLKSDAPLEEFEGKIPLSITPPFVPFTATYTTELRETHITTVDSPVSEIPKTLTESKSESKSVLKESNETEESEAETSGSKISSLMRDSKELMEATSKIISGIKSKTDETKSDTDPGTVHRMLVTASSEDGGEETEICPKGTITFSKSSESSGRSSPDLSTQKLKEEDDNKMSSGKSTPDIKITAEHEKADLESTEKVFLDEAKDSGKSTPKSGKMSPEIREQSPTSDSGIIEVTKQDFQKSGKSTPDRSGKSTPDIKEKGASVETDKKSSDSGRSTPDTAPTKIDTLTKPVVKTAFDSGRSSPDSKSIEEIKQLEKPEHEKTTADEADQVFDEHKSLTTSDKLSEKSSSVEHKHDVVTEDSRASITEVSEPLSSTSESKEISSDTSGIEKQEEQQVVGDIQQKQEVDLEKRIQSSLTDASGKSTPDITQSVISGKSSPDLKQDSESITSRTSTPGLKEIAEDKREESKDKGLTSDTSDPLGKDLPAKDINLEAADGRGPKNIHIESKLDELKTDEIPPAYEDLEQMKVKVLDDTQFQTSTVSAPLKTEVETKDIDKAVDIKMSEKKIYTIKDEEDNIVKKEVEVKSIVVQEKVEDPTLDKKTSVKHEDIKIEQDAETKENVHKDKDNSLNIQTAAPSECESIKATQEVIPSDKKDGLTEKPDIATEEHTKNGIIADTQEVIPSDKKDGLTEKPDIATEEHTKNGIIADQTMNEKERELKDNDTKITEVGDVITKDIKQEISKPADKTEEELRKETELLDKGDSNETDKPLRYEIEVVNKMQSALDAIGQEMQAECLKRSKSAEHDEHIEKDETSDIDAKHDKDISKSVLTQHEIDAKEIPQAKETTEHQKHSEESKVKDKDESSKVAIKDAAQQGEKLSKKEEKSIISYEIETADSKLLASDSKADVKVTVMSQETEDKDKRQTIEDTKIPEKNDDQELSKTVTEDKESLVKPADEQTIQERSTNIPTDFTAAEIAQELAEDSKDVKETTHDSTSASDDIAAVDETKQLIQKQDITTDASEKRAKQDDLKSLTAKELPTDSQHHTILTKEDSKPNDTEIIIKKDVLDTSTEIPDIKQYVEKDIAKDFREKDPRRSSFKRCEARRSVKDDESKEKTLTASEKKILEEAVLKDAKHGEKEPAEDPTDTKTILEEKVLPSTEDKVQDSSGKKEFSEDVAIKKSDMQEQLSVDHSDGQLKNCKIKEETKTESDEISTKVIVEATVVKPESQDVVKVKEESPKETDISTLTKHLIDKTHIDNQETKDDTSETIGTTKTIEREELSSIEKIVSGAKEDISNVVETGTKIVETYVTTSDAAKDIQQVESKILPADKEHENEISHAKHSDITTTIELSRHIDKDVKGKVDEPSTEKESAKLEESKSVDQKVVDSTAKIVEDNSDSSKSSVIVDDIKTGDDKHDIHSAVEESDAVTSIKTETSVVEKTVKDTITSKDLDIGKDILGKGIKDEVRVCIKSEKEVSTKDDATKESISSIACSSKELAKPEESSLSGKSTPDIADVERDKQIQETLTYEKHIPGSSTPPTVPVSPIVKDIHTDIKSDISPEKKMETTVSTIKEQDIRSYTPGSDEYEHGISSTHSDISLSQMSRAPHLLEGDEARESDEDDILGSPTSVTSQIGHSPSSQYDFDDDKRLSKTDQMSVSFYGTLPGDADDSGFKSGRFLDDSDLDFEKAMQEHRQVRGEDLTGESSSYLYEITAAKQSGIMKEESGKKTDIMTSSFIGTELPDRSTTVDTSKEKDPIGSWGKPLSLPSPAPPDNKGTPKKEKKLPPNVTAKNKLNDDKKRSESPSKKQRKSGGPIYVDLTYVPHHGNSNYSYVDFFKRIRARYYVFSGIEPSKEVYNALLEAKQTWEDKELDIQDTGLDLCRKYPYQQEKDLVKRWGTKRENKERTSII